MTDFVELRKQMIKYQLATRGLKDDVLLTAMNTVPREKFVPTELIEFAYQDSPLPIAASQTISQPYIVALMIAALELKPEDKVLEVGTGSGYAAAVLSKLARKVFTIERHKVLADSARVTLHHLGYKNALVFHADGTLGLPKEAPFDAIVVAAGGPSVPELLKHQLAIGGRMVIPVGSTLHSQNLMRIRRVGQNEFIEESLGDVRFVPLIGAAGWEEEYVETPEEKEPALSLPEQIYQNSEHFANIDDCNLDNLLERIGDSRIVLLGESSHGSAEFYDMRARITKELIEKKGFTIIAAEADWPDATHINHHIQSTSDESMQETPPFTRFPTWMWLNYSVLNFSHWLKSFNNDIQMPEDKVGFYGLDLYSMSTSMDAVLSYLESVDPQTAEIARLRYGCLTPWASEPSLYARVTMNKQYKECESDVVATLHDLLKKRLDYSAADGNRFFNAEQNARLVASAERYYRTMYYAENNSWNLRDQHMFDTLQSIMAHRGESSKVVVWAHNSHIGDARATQMSARGEFNLGQLARQYYGDSAYLIGFGTDHGTVAAASEWGGPMEVKQIQPSHIDSYEYLFHQVKTDNLILPLRQQMHKAVGKKLMNERLERAIGVIYRPESELQSHYFYAALPHQFDEYIWFDETSAVQPVNRDTIQDIFDTFPFGL